MKNKDLEFRIRVLELETYNLKQRLNHATNIGGVMMDKLGLKISDFPFKADRILPDPWEKLKDSIVEIFGTIKGN